jgi:hypothetical protein
VTKTDVTWMVAMVGIAFGCTKSPQSDGGAAASEAPPTRTGATEPAAPNTEVAPAVVGGACAYRDVPGKVTVERIENPAPTDNNCSADPMRVVLRFHATESSAARPDQDTGHLTLFDGKNPPKACFETAGIRVGAEFAAKRREITSGTCTPRILEPDVPRLDACREACFGK